MKTREHQCSCALWPEPQLNTEARLWPTAHGWPQDVARPGAGRAAQKPPYAVLRIWAQNLYRNLPATPRSSGSLGVCVISKLLSCDENR